jgi:acid phosphatase family membrane protein YuiD
MTILRTYPFLIPLVVMFASEAIKILMETLESGSWKGGLFRPGGMPSTHSAFVTSLLIIVWFKTGFDSVEFAIAFVFAAITWFDATSSRRAIGEQAKVLNQLQHLRHFSERLGHTHLEVIGGIIFGSTITLIGIWLSTVTF